MESNGGSPLLIILSVKNSASTTGAQRIVPAGTRRGPRHPTVTVWCTLKRCALHTVACSPGRISLEDGPPKRDRGRPTRPALPRSPRTRFPTIRDPRSEHPAPASGPQIREGVRPPRPLSPKRAWDAWRFSHVGARPHILRRFAAVRCRNGRLDPVRTPPAPEKAPLASASGARRLDAQPTFLAPLPSAGGTGPVHF